MKLPGRGVVYVAPPDHHLLVKREYMRITRGPRENRRNLVLAIGKQTTR